MHKLTLQVDIAGKTIAGGKDSNEDAICWQMPTDPHLQLYKGCVLALADGVSSAEAGALASDRATSDFITDYLKTPDSWSTAHSAGIVLSTINSALYQQSRTYQSDERGHLCTFTGLIVKSRTAYWFHIGDSRLYLFRKGTIRQLSIDHTMRLSEQRQFLGRALGMDESVSWQHDSIAIEVGDVFLLCSDGLSDFVSDLELAALLSVPLSLQDKSERALELATASDDNVSLILCEVTALGDDCLDEYSERMTRLPVLPALVPGNKVDGYEVVQTLFASSRSHLYLVKDSLNQANYVLKTPSQNFADDVAYLERFIREEWVGLRIDDAHVVKVIQQGRSRTFLYYLLEYLEGDSLDCWLLQQAQPLRPSIAISLVKQIADGLNAFHKLGMIHQDLKPANIMRLADGQLKIVDFGSVFVPGLAEIYSPILQELALGTASYSDPHYLHGHNSVEQGDVYALATVAYELFTGFLPYGEQVDECRSLSDYQKLKYVSATKRNSRIPLWFDRALERGVSFDLHQRYLTIEHLVKDLQNPNPLYLRQQVVAATKNNKLLFWQLMSGFWFVTLLLVIWLFSTQR